MEVLQLTTKQTVTIREAAQRWVNEFNAIPQQLITKAYPNMEEIDILCTDLECTHCGNTEYTEIEEDDGSEEKILTCDNCEHAEFSEKYDLPMWGTMWTVSNLDEDWIKDNLETMRKCGFWVYESDELGVFIGIDGAGYDFYADHWIPLYKARGLQWHNAE